MHIDWLTVAAQLVNFLVLVWLLRRFLYQPVIDVMARREQRIVGRLQEATQREQQAQAEADVYGEKIAAVARDRERALADARDAAERERRELVEAAREQARVSRERWQKDLEREQADFRARLVRELADAGIEVARRALADLADSTLEEQALATLARRVRALPVSERAALAAAPRLRLSCAFEPDAAAIETLRQSLAATLEADVELECVIEPGLLFGVELSGGGYRLAWSVSGYLDEIADEVRARIDEARQSSQGGPRDPGQ